MKESGQSKRQRLHDKEQTSTPASDNKWNKEREGRSWLGEKVDEEWISAC